MRMRASMRTDSSSTSTEQASRRRADIERKSRPNDQHSDTLDASLGKILRRF